MDTIQGLGWKSGMDEMIRWKDEMRACYCICGWPCAFEATCSKRLWPTGHLPKSVLWTENWHRMHCLKQGDLWIHEEKDSTDQSPLSGRIFLYRLGSWHQNCGQVLKIVKCLQAHCWIWPKHKPRQVMIIFTIWWHLRSGLEGLKAWCFEIPQAIDKFPRSQTMSDFRLPCMEKYGICGATSATVWNAWKHFWDLGFGQVWTTSS